MTEEVLRYDHNQAVHYRDEVAMLRNLIAALLERHPDGMFVSDVSVRAERGRDVVVTRHPQREGYVLYLEERP